MTSTAATMSSATTSVWLMLIAMMLPVRVQAQTPGSLTCSPSVIAGGSGDSATCTVTLAAAAPAGGTRVTLASSRVELAALVPDVTVPAGQTAATFRVGTNPGYRRYSQLAFAVTISATANSATRSATLQITAQAPPPDFNSGSQGGSNTQWDGLMCGGIAPIGGYPDILYDCTAATGTGFGSCTFRQECSLGCRRVPPNGGTFNDFCATTGPNPITLSRNVIASGDRVPAAVVAEAPAGSAPAQEQGVPRVIDPNVNSASFPQNGISFPDGATSVGFDVATSYVPAIQFVEVGGFWFNDAIPPLLITSGRGGHAWLVMLPPDPPPAVAMPTLGDFKITGLNPVTGGETTIGQIDLSGLSRAGGPTITLTSSVPEVVPSASVVAPATDRLFGFQVPIATRAPAADTAVTITASDGRYRFSAMLTVRVPPPPPVLADLTVNPTSVVGGNPATGTVTLSAAQTGPTQVTLSTPAPASVATIPASVTVPAGATSATFPISTSPVAETFNMNVFADLAGSPGQQALLLITPGSSPPPPGGDTSAFRSPAANARDSGGDGNGFESNPSSAHADDASAAADVNSGSGTGTSCTSGGKDRHRFFNYGFAIPAGASIAGIEVRLDARADSTSGSPKMCVQLSWDGGSTWTAAKATPTLGTSMASYTLGSTSDTWGRAWTAANFADASFRVRVINVSSSTSRDFFLDWIAVRPQYPTGGAASLGAVSLSPSTVTGGTASTGTVTLTATAPSGGAAVSLSSSHTAATVPASVTVPAGAATASFTVTTGSVTASTPATISATYGGVTRSGVLTVSPSSQPATATLTVTATGRSGERVISSPAGIGVNVGTTGSASFPAGTSITLSVSNGRDAIWSGACSSGGNKTRTCTFTLNANATVTANVQ